jgi:Uma2 family endonuclease
MSTTMLEPAQESKIVHSHEDDYEIIAGERVENASMGSRSSFLANRLGQSMGYAARLADAGEVALEVLFQLDEDGDDQRKPDLAFLTTEQLLLHPNDGPADPNAWKITPYLAVEFVSPTNTFSELIRKKNDYFRLGIQRVWMIDQANEEAHCYHNPTEMHVLRGEAEFSLEPLIPAWKLKLSELLHPRTK